MDRLHTHLVCVVCFTACQLVVSSLTVPTLTRVCALHLLCRQATLSERVSTCSHARRRPLALWVMKLARLLRAACLCTSIARSATLWGNPHACTRDTSLRQLISQYLEKAAVATAVIFTHPGGGLGNEMNVVLHAFLRAMLAGKRLLVASTPVMHYFEPSPMWSMADTNALSLLSRTNISVEHHKSENWLPFSGADYDLWKKVLTVLTPNASALVSCASHLLFQPNAIVANAMQPFLKTCRHSKVIGVHLRQSDQEMALRQNVSHRRLELVMGHRPYCLQTKDIIRAVASCNNAAALRWPNVSVYVASDSSSTIKSLRQGLQQTRVGLITSDGEPYHTGRHIIMPNGSDPFVKALVDFSIMDHVEHFFSNCDLLACFHRGLPASLWSLQETRNESWTKWSTPSTKDLSRRCGNTFAGNIWLRRFHSHTQSPSLSDCKL